MPGAEPTNNVAERTLRGYVIWRKVGEISTAICAQGKLNAVTALFAMGIFRPTPLSRCRIFASFHSAQ
jgi:hypothetical protein